MPFSEEQQPCRDVAAANPRYRLQGCYRQQSCSQPLGPKQCSDPPARSTRSAASARRFTAGFALPHLPRGQGPVGSRAAPRCALCDDRDTREKHRSP